jgi:hypothetical protein
MVRREMNPLEMRKTNLISGRYMNEMMLIFSVGIVAGIVLGILMVHE